MRWRHVLKDQEGQMAVELAVAVPVVLAVLVVVVDSMLFVRECARFDHLAAQAVIACAASAENGAYGDAERADSVRAALAASFGEHGEAVDVAVEAAAGVPLWQKRVFACTLRMAPWPLASPNATVFGVRVPALLSHTYRLALDPYTPGRLL